MAHHKLSIILCVGPDQGVSNSTWAGRTILKCMMDRASFSAVQG